ncbi:MAG: DUF4956 domain-containing protein [Bacteroidia bacterium]|nr:DUF4956 domain-containing protein [Bacteroidia bacterium]
MNIFESYLEEFSQSVSLGDFLINLFFAAALCAILRQFYIRFGNAISNRKRFANIFLPLGLTTLLIITIVKSSIALSLGLVGALSIVRFRAAIKDPEELTYLFLCIAIGLAAGASQILIAFVAFVFILLFMYFLHRYNGFEELKKSDAMYLNIQTDVEDVKVVSEVLTELFPFVELKRLDKGLEQMSLSYRIKTDSLDQISSLQTKLTALSASTTYSLVDQAELAL